ncbi:MAG: chemotaxis response regulator protein-glutamate methylesterase [Leptospira sp.]|nr:chemotaxis response regulator protein-glutamate methylesterase [Leptospira sp.]
MEPISVMIVDDSQTFRNLLRDSLAQDSEINVITSATNGKLALPRIKYYNPDIVLLDQEMPEMTGIEALEYLQKNHIQTKVIMISAHTVKGARLTMKALQLGAMDFVTKPEGGTEGFLDFVNNQIITKIKAIGRKISIEKNSQSRVPEKPISSNASDYDVCAIGISTGGPTALRELVSGIRKDFSGTILIAQHMPPLFTRYMAESLNDVSAIPVVEAEDQMAVRKGTIYIAPGGRQMLIEQKNGSRFIKITDIPEEKLCRPSVNVLFKSVAEIYGKNALGVIMTGMGEDGYLGIKELKSKGAYIIGQNKESCMIYGMPAKPASEGLLDEVLDIDGIAQRINRLAGKCK